MIGIIKHIRIISDNMTAVSYITAMGGCQSEECDSITKNVWEWAIAHNNWLSAVYTLINRTLLQISYPVNSIWRWNGN